jgi:hypothetical protein
VIDLPGELTETARTFSQFLSATIGPPVALVSAPRQTPSSSPELPPPNLTPTIVVPVDVAGSQRSSKGKSKGKVGLELSVGEWKRKSIKVDQLTFW